MHSESRLKFILHRIRWLRVVLDEAHTIKNASTNAARAAFRLHSQRRWCVTGTPIQNSLNDLHSLLKFLRHEPWSSSTWWQRVIELPFRKGDDKALSRLQVINMTVNKQNREELFLVRSLSLSWNYSTL